MAKEKPKDKSAMNEMRKGAKDTFKKTTSNMSKGKKGKIGY